MTDGIIEQIKEKSVKLVELEKRYEEKEQELKELEKDIAELSEKELPMLFDKIGMVEFTLSDGTRVEMKQEVFARLAVQDEKARKDALVWLREQNAGDIIQHKIVINSPTDNVRNNLIIHSIPFKEEENVNTNTLKAFLKSFLGISSPTSQGDVRDVPKGLGLYIKHKITTSK